MHLKLKHPLLSIQFSEFSINGVNNSDTFDIWRKKTNGIIEEISDLTKKPIIQVKIQGKDIDADHIQAQIGRLNSLALECKWKMITKQTSDSSVFLDRPNVIKDELFRLSANALGSEQDAKFAIKELLPVLSTDGTDQALQIILESYEKFKKEENQ